MNRPSRSSPSIAIRRSIGSKSSLKVKRRQEILRIRDQMRPHFAAIRAKALEELPGYSDKSKIGKSMSYFLKNEAGLTRFLDDPRLPIDNNPQERLLRNPVIGRKTWYGTHSKLGAETAAILFSLVESPGGHLKFPHPWPGQIPPGDRASTSSLA